ncbi:MAG: MarR family winged helix-turn-helix transcriptional regulator [Pusillimonas sp.]
MSDDPFIKLYDLPGYLLRRSGQFVNAHFEAEMGHLGLTASQLAAFLAVNIKPGMQQRELAAALNWDEATVGGMVRRLVAQGLLDRRNSARSKRGLEIYMTPKGEALYASAAPHIARIQDNVLQRLEQDEREELLRLLSKMLGERNSHYQSSDKGTAP